ncbi:MAG: M50 family metallopeptidase [Deltaproteobacteria bacterium]|nr:M50 family metallopeptidase [Deltaproteobacteria bacterium]
MMKRLLKLVFIVVSIPLTVGFALALLPIAGHFVAFETRHILFLSGAGAALLGYPWLRRSQFFRTFEHELTHLLAAKAFFAKWESLNVKSSGDGEVRYSRESNFVIALAPYFLPLFAAAFALLSPALHPKIAVYALVPAGFLLMHHLYSSIAEMLVGQPDIRESGRIFSFAFIALLGLLTYGCIIAFAAGGCPAVLEYLMAGPERAFEIGTTYAPTLLHRTAALLRGLF